MRLKHLGMGLLLVLVCSTSSCQKSERANLIGRWTSRGGPNMIFQEDGIVYTINKGDRRQKGLYYLNTETKPQTIIMDMRRSDLKSILYFDFAAFSSKHIELTPTHLKRVGEKKKESERKRKLLFQKVDPNDPLRGENSIANTASTRPNTR